PGGSTPAPARREKSSPTFPSHSPPHSSYNAGKLKPAGREPTCALEPHPPADLPGVLLNCQTFPCGATRITLRSRSCFCILCTALAALAYAFFALTPSKASAQPGKPVSFINDVAPILKENCFGCHGAKNPKGKFDMTRFEKLLAGGTKENVIVHGKPEDSYLVDAITAAATDKKRMPPADNGEALSKEKMDVIVRWIKEGAKLDPELKKDSDLLRELRVRWKPPAPPASYPFPV